MDSILAGNDPSASYAGVGNFDDAFEIDDNLFLGITSQLATESEADAVSFHLPTCWDTPELDPTHSIDPVLLQPRSTLPNLEGDSGSLLYPEKRLDPATPNNTSSPPPHHQQEVEHSHRDLESKPESRRRKRASEWQERQSLIKRLYLVEDKTLAITRQILKDEHHFDASEKAYKEQFRDWGWEKNLKRETVEFMLSKEQHRQTLGKQTVFEYKGVEVPNSKLRHSYKRSAKLTNTPSLSSTKTPMFVPYYTPPSTFNSSYKKHMTSNTQAQMVTLPRPTTPPKGSSGLLPTNRYHENIVAIEDSINRGVESGFDVEPTAITKFEIALNDFIFKCLSYNDIDSAVSYFNQRDLPHKLWLGNGDNRYSQDEDMRVVNQMISYCKAGCLIAVHRFAEGDAVIDRILRTFHETPAFGPATRVSPIKVMFSNLSDLLVSQSLLPNPLKLQTILMLRKIQCTIVVLELEPWKWDKVEIRMDQRHELVLTEMTSYSSNDMLVSGQSRVGFVLAALDILLYHYRLVSNHEQLRVVLEKTQATLDNLLYTDHVNFDLALHTGHALVEAYVLLRLEEQADYWRSKMDSLPSRLLSKYRIPNSSHARWSRTVPLLHAPLECFLNQDWPYIKLPWGDELEEL
ncbi:hypothetical protein MMC13_002758 [Lambiella insularis]|nr:hypothetical protein [Lambiella insularis]